MLANSRETINHTIGVAVLSAVGSRHSGMGQVWRHMMKAHEILFACSISTDRYFMLQFDTKSDERSDRPLLYTIVVILPLHTDLCKRALVCWKDAPCFSKHLTDPSKSIRTNQMMLPNVGTDTSLPTATEVE